MISSPLRLKSLILNLSKLNFVYPLLNDNLNVILLKTKVFSNTIISGRQFTKSNFNFNNSLIYPTNINKVVSLDPDEVEIVHEESEIKNSNRVNKRKTDRKKLRNHKEKVENSVFSENEFEKSNKNNENVAENINNLKIISYKQSVHILRREMLSLQTKPKKLRQEKIVVEGKRLIHDALCAGVKPEVIFFTRICLLNNLNLPADVKLCWVPYNNLKLWSSVVTSSGLLGVFKKPTEIKTSKNENILPITVICDQVRDPGNMGSILRVAVGAGCKKILLTKGCADIWDSKVLRSGGGAHFHFLPLIKLLWKDIENEVSEEDKIILADNEHPSSRDSFDEDKNNSNEAKSFSKMKSSICNQFPLLQYDNVTNGKQSVVIVIGGETEGLSEDAYLFAEKRQGVRTFIPMSNSIESLNSAVALGILLYEIRRQMEEISRRCLINFV